MRDKAEFDAAVAAAEREEMVPTVPDRFVVFGFKRTDTGVYKTSFHLMKGPTESLQSFFVVSVCVGRDRDDLEAECGGRTENRSFEVRDGGNGVYVLVFPEDELDDAIEVSGDSTSLKRAFDEGRGRWAPETRSS